MGSAPMQWSACCICSLWPMCHRFGGGYVWALSQWCHVWAPHWSVGLWSNGLASQSVSKAVPEHRLAGWSQGRKYETGWLHT